MNVVCLVGHNYGDHFGYTQRDVIVLNTEKMDRELNQNQIIGVIAHEFAHHIKGHSAPMEPGLKEKNEGGAGQLLKEWGF
jgi:hypothetical protein